MLQIKNDDEKGSSDNEEEEVLKVMVDILGHLILPTCNPAWLKLQQDIVHNIFTKAYSKFDFSYFTNILITTSENQ